MPSRAPNTSSCWKSSLAFCTRRCNLTVTVPCVELLECGGSTPLWLALVKASIHANFRYLTKGMKWWYGGCADLTPYYPYREDVIHFHRVWKQVCDRHCPIVEYQRLKKWCDEYFFLTHRGEPRGVGGIFFDYLEGDFDSLFVFVRDAGDHFLDAYLPIVRRRKDESYSERERAFQEYRRGRYVEFNLLYDRGTTFGLKTGGRVESILMSLPPVVRWEYDYRPGRGTREAELYDVYLKPRDWAEEAP